MRLIKSIVLATTVALASTAVAQDCLVSTTARAIFSGLPQVAAERFDREKGEYSATLQDGSSVTAQFEQCGLGLRASYLIENKSENLMDPIKFLLQQILPSKDSIDTVIPQLQRYTKEDFYKGIRLQDINGEHWVQAKDSPSALYDLVLHYRWIPPEH